MTMQQNKSERLEARLSPEQKALFQHAASLEGRSLTDFAISALLHAARKIIKEHAVIHLSLHDQQAFVQAITEPSKPNSRLIKAAKRHDKLIKD